MPRNFCLAKTGKWKCPKALFASDVILVCLSKNSVDRAGYVQKEIAFALDKALEKPEGTIFIIPAKLEECNVPQRLNRFQWVDLYRDDGRKRLMLSLNKRAAQIGPAVEQAIVADDTLEREKLELEAKEKLARRYAERENEECEKVKRDADKKDTREKVERESIARAELERTEQEGKEKLTGGNETNDALAKTSREKRKQEYQEIIEQNTVEKPHEKVVPPSASTSEIINRLPQRKNVKEEPIKTESALLPREDTKQEKLVTQIPVEVELPRPIFLEKKSTRQFNLRLIGVVVVGLVLITLCIWGGINYFNSLISNSPKATNTSALQTCFLLPQLRLIYQLLALKLPLHFELPQYQ